MPYDIIVGRDDSDKKKFENRGLAYLGKCYVKMGNYTSLSNPILLDLARSHVILVSGKRGSGKSHTLGVLAEEICSMPEEVKENISPLIFDTMGIFWTMKFKNEKERELLREWNLKPKELPIKIFVPFGKFNEYYQKNIPIDDKFAIKVSELEVEDWLLTFDLGMMDPVSISIERVISNLKKEKEDFFIFDILEKIKTIDDKEETKKAASALFDSASSWGIFAEKKEEETESLKLLEAGRTTVLDLSCYSSVGSFNIRALIIGILSRKIFAERMMQRKQEELEAIHGLGSSEGKKELPLVWIFIDECHEFLSKDEKTPATDSLLQLLREGRQPGISLVLATQQPGIIHRDVMTQADIVISHRVTAKPDIEALNNIMQTYLFDNIKRYLDDLPNLKGSAIVLDDNSERIYPIRVRPRFTWHGGEAPSALSKSLHNQPL